MDASDVAPRVVRVRSVKMVGLDMDFRGRQRRQQQQRRQGNQVWRLPRGARCPSAWAPFQGQCQQPWPVARRKRAAGSGQRGWQPRPRPAAAPKAKAAGGSAASGPKAAGATDPEVAGGSVGAGSAVGPSMTAASGGSAAQTTAASGTSAKVACGSVTMVVAASGPMVKVAGGSVTMVAPRQRRDPGPTAKADAGRAGEMMMVVGLGPVVKEADRSTAETTMKVAGGTLTVMRTAATSGPTVKVAGGSTVTSGPAAMSAASSSGATGPAAKVANEIIQFSSFGSQAATPLPKDNSGISVSTVEPNSSSTLAFKGSVVSMAATKRHNNNNVPVCGTPAAKLLKLPWPDDNHSPALLEAFKAVVAAGGSGWLDPVAVAAVKTELEVGCSSEEDLGSGSRETSGKSSEPQQLTWTPTLLVTERKRKKKPISQERTTLVNLVPCTENRIMDPKPNPLGSEDQAEAYNMEPMSFFPPDSPIRSMVPGGDNFMQAEPKEIWICGHSVILVTKRRASTHPHGLQLGFPSSSAFLYWHGIQAMLWDQLLPLLHEIYYLRSFPSIIVIHLGENDLVQHTSMSLIVKMKNDLGILRRAFPDAHIIWSSLLPRRFWKGAEKPVSIEKARKGINREMSHYCSENGIIFLRHDLITYDKPNMFLPDVDDLSDVGADVFTADLKGALHSCLGFGKG
ncbi:diacylglycerol kinase epsilon [Platysternon megacephalum]|uniref:Diacylglycerol kinase epsilon n=1 Tax=Platysternon megacephalum TaxID=55544 RepID=A0A4D9DUV7_9SAUR|nr:diacylglycerol kinase epsilon [Platysternon megacephalum]